jgi:hypothetical protein
MKVPVLNTIPQIQSAIAELYRIVGAMQKEAPKVDESVQAPIRRGRPPKVEVENQEG